MDGMQCGIACIAMVCAHYGVRYSLPFLEKICTPSKEGVSLKGLTDLCDRLFIHSSAGRVSLAQLKDCPLPAVIHWNQNHFVVLYKIKDNEFYIADPAFGRRRVDSATMERNWIYNQESVNPKGIALFLEPGARFGEVCDPSYNNKASILSLAHYIDAHRSVFIKIALCLLVATGLQLIFPFLTQAIVDRGIRNSDLHFIWLVLIGELTMTIALMTTNFLRSRMLLKVSTFINIDMVSGFFSKLLQLPMGFFDTKLFGDLMQRMTDHSRIQVFITEHSLNLLFSLVSFVILGCVLAFYNLTVFLVFFFGVAVYSLWISIFLRKRRDLDYELFERSATCQSKTVQFLKGIQEIKLQNCESLRRKEWENAQQGLFNIRMRMLAQQQRENAGGTVINETKNIIITFLTASAVIHGELTLGMMMAVQYIIGQLNSPFAQLVQFLYSLQEVRMSLERVTEIQDRKDEDNETRTVTVNPKTVKVIEFDDVTFRYDRHASAKTLDALSVSIPANRITAVVGASGSGKTTLIKLMLGYYMPDKGVLRIGDDDIQSVKLKEWRKRCGVVMQDGLIFSDSIARNIASADKNIDYDRLEEAARTANIYEYVMSLPLKFDTRIGSDGNGLSQGQKQRILIARAVYRNPDFFFLDEATNSLDSKNEREIVEKLNRFSKGRTVVVVAHRLSTVRNADQIVVMDKGKVVEIGNHTSLIDRKGAYYNLVKNQL